ncbi:MAG: 16S rRNA (cytosine(967)-C(5))-methyltransferase RsmB [Candidatus Sericytochromatia bacterium]|nr:16S rRNA (cytosine(967)-C(5))-methyltransferase RsmB [Candidatus Sericytochromatia bacterium]
MTRDVRAKQDPQARSAREWALGKLIAIEAEGGYANLGRQDLSHMPPPERSLAVELSHGATRRRATLDWYLAQVLKGRLEDLTPPIRNNLRLATYQLLFLDRIRPAAAVDEAVKLARKHGHEGVARLTNGVLRNLQRRMETLSPPAFKDNPLLALTARYSLPEWLAREWLALHGPDAELLAQWSITPPTLSLRANTLKRTRESLQEELSALGIAATPDPWLPEGLRLNQSIDPTALAAFSAGEFYVQDEAAMWAARLVKPASGQTILDIGAAPGGKSTHLAALMGDQGCIWAIDRSATRLKLLEENCRRLGVSSVRALARDACDLSELPVADRILLDAPCSGLGVLPRKPDLRWRQTPVTRGELAQLQSQLLDAAVARLKPGGLLVYSTCTMSRQENQDVVEALLNRQPQLRFDDMGEDLPADWRNELEGEGGMLQLHPIRHGVDGFFIARLRREV